MRHLNSLRGQTINSDATPDTINWNAVGYDSKVEIYIYTSRRILGINRKITLQVNYDDNEGTLLYNTNAGIDNENDYVNATDPYSLGFIPLVNGETFTINNGDVVDFGVDTFTSGVTDWVTIYNVTDGFKILDKIDLA